MQRSAAGRVARSLYHTPAQNAAEARFVEQMGRYGANGFAAPRDGRRGPAAGSMTLRLGKTALDQEPDREDKRDGDDEAEPAVTDHDALGRDLPGDHPENEGDRADANAVSDDEVGYSEKGCVRQGTPRAGLRSQPPAADAPCSTWRLRSGKPLACG